MLKKAFSILLIYLPAGFVVASVLLVTILKWVPVSMTPLMIVRYWQNHKDAGFKQEKEWVRLCDVSDEMKSAVIASEDARFYQHHGFDFEELRAMQHEVLFDGSRVRGCSTISQQTAKNCFTFCTHSWFRKMFEAYYTVLIERIWGKERILEVYLNVAEMGYGIYGAEAAARKYFNIHAAELTMSDSSSLACCLPNPLHRSPDWVNKHMASRRAEIAKRAVR